MKLLMILHGVLIGFTRLQSCQQDRSMHLGRSIFEGLKVAPFRLDREKVQLSNLVEMSISGPPPASKIDRCTLEKAIDRRRRHDLAGPSGPLMCACAPVLP